MLIKKEKKSFKIVNNKKREDKIKENIGNIGKIVEENDKIICYVNKKMFEKNRKEKNNIKLNGFMPCSKIETEENEKLDLNKKVYYVFDNINFDSHIFLSSRMGTNILFKNCVFNKGIDILSSDEVVFVNNKYIYNESNNDQKYFFCVRNTNKISFINDNLVNYSDVKFMDKENPNFNIKINADRIDIINTLISSENDSIIDLTANYLNLTTSELLSGNIFINSKNIRNMESKIKSSNYEIVNCDDITSARHKLISELKKIRNLKDSDEKILKKTI